MTSLTGLVYCNIIEAWRTTRLNVLNFLINLKDLNERFPFTHDTDIETSNEGFPFSKVEKKIMFISSTGIAATTVFSGVQVAP